MPLLYTKTNTNLSTMKRGFVQVYTGNGKGKTTAALGLALRAAGAGLKVFIGQFAKGKFCSEHNALKRFEDLITIEQYGTEQFIIDTVSEADRDKARQNITKVEQIVKSGKYDVVILDEASVALNLHLITLSDILNIIKSKPVSTEIVITGRNAPEELIDAADLVTEMKEIKHYYSKGISARKGIEM